MKKQEKKKYSVIGLYVYENKKLLETNDLLEATEKLKELKTLITQYEDLKMMVYILNNETQDMEYFTLNYNDQENQKSENIEKNINISNELTTPYLENIKIFLEYLSKKTFISLLYKTRKGKESKEKLIEIMEKMLNLTEKLIELKKTN